MNGTEILGWAAARVRGDDTGQAHVLVVLPGAAGVSNACGSPQPTHGQCHPAPPDYARGVCFRCARRVLPS